MKRRHLVLFLLALVVSVCACAQVGEKPVRVGIAWQPWQGSYDRVIRSIELAGGEPVILDQLRPAGFDYDSLKLAPKYVDSDGVLLPEYAEAVKRLTYHGTNADSLLNGVDAVVFLGGGDVSSTLLAKPQPWHGIEEDNNCNATRDVSEYLTMAYCLDHNIAVLGLCRGMQMLGVVSGAELIQDLGTYYSSLGREYGYIHRSHRDQNGNRHYLAHDVVVTDRSSLVYSIAGVDTIRNVPSWHHQVVGDVRGTALKVTGVTPDGDLNIIEVIERTDKGFALGVQYHPEEAIRKHLDGEADANRFMSLDDAVKYFAALIDYVKSHR